MSIPFLAQYLGDWAITQGQSSYWLNLVGAITDEVHIYISYIKSYGFPILTADSIIGVVFSEQRNHINTYLQEYSVADSAAKVSQERTNTMRTWDPLWCIFILNMWFKTKLVRYPRDINWTKNRQNISLRFTYVDRTQISLVLHHSRGGGKRMEFTTQVMICKMNIFAVALQ